MKIRSLIIFILTLVFSPLTQADLVSDEAQLGADVGAMSYCKDKYGDDETDGLYDILRIKTLKAYDDLDEDTRLKALVFRNSAEEKGDYLGKSLDKDRCDSLRKLLQLKY